MESTHAPLRSLLAAISLNLLSIFGGQDGDADAVVVNPGEFPWVIYLGNSTERRMRFSSRQNEGSESLAEMARQAHAQGTGKADLVRGAVQALLAASEVDRAGVWIDEGDIDYRSPRGWAVLRGTVSDRSGEDAPSDWSRLSLEALPSLESLANGRIIQMDLDGTSEQLILGALLELQRAVWAPVLLAGTTQARNIVTRACRSHLG